MKYDTAKIKTKSIVSYLKSRGVEIPDSKRGRIKMLAPHRNECKASFYIYLQTNTFYDFASGEGGSIIDLCMLFEKKSYIEALKILSDAILPKAILSPTSQIKQPSKIKIHSVKELRSPYLFRYAKGRGISGTILKYWCKEVSASLHDCPPYNYIGFGSGSSFELRNGMKSINKLSTSRKSHFIKGLNSEVLTVFEGFFDFLTVQQISFNQSGKIEQPKTDVLVLNGTGYLAKFENYNSYKKILSCMDIDKGGYKALEQLKTLYTGVIVNATAAYSAKMKIEGTDWNKMYVNLLTQSGLKF